MNRTILAKVRYMLNESCLPKIFWAEATNTVVYLINRSPCSAIKFQTPMHVWSGKKPSLTHLKPFGCLAYIHMNQEKLNPKAVKGVFIGYPTGVKGYKVYLINERKCVVSRNVIFFMKMLLVRLTCRKFKVHQKLIQFSLRWSTYLVITLKVPLMRQTTRKMNKLPQVPPGQQVNRSKSLMLAVP